MQEFKTKKVYHLYALLCEDKKYYIGITSKPDPYERINEHINGYYTAQWVKKHKAVRNIEMLRLGEISHDEAQALENQRTLQYMKKYGYQNVRGGKFNYSGKYVKVGSRYFRDDEFNTLLVVSALTVIIVILAVQK